MQSKNKKIDREAADTVIASILKTVDKLEESIKRHGSSSWTPPHCSICGLKESVDGYYPTQTDKLGWVHLSCMKDKFEYESTK